MHRGETHREKRRSVKREAEIRVRLKNSRTARSHQQRGESPPEPLQGAQPGRIVDVWPPEAGEDTFLLF